MDFQNGRLFKETYHFYSFWGAFDGITALYGLPTIPDIRLENFIGPFCTVQESDSCPLTRMFLRIFKIQCQLSLKAMKI